MLTAMNSAVTGLNAQSEAMNVIGDNIANVKTVAFKSNRMTFSNIMAQVLAGDNVGNGVQTWDTSAMWTQGAPETTGNNTDLAINGEGFFMLKSGSDTRTTYYTRAGQFYFDKDGFLVDPTGLIVQGTQINEDGTLGTMGNIQVDQDKVDAKATGEFSINLNLDAAADVNDTYTTTVSVYDSLGNEVPLNLIFTKTADNTWTWDVYLPDATTSSGSGTLNFNSDGTLGPAASTDPTISIPMTNGANDLALTWDLYNYDPVAAPAGGPTNGYVTQYSGVYSTNLITQDGYPFGDLMRVAIDEDGILTGYYTNGQLKNLYQIELAGFRNNQGLTSLGNNLFLESTASGQATSGNPGTGTLGTITPEALEMSNVDLASEFVNLITTQRAFQANSKVISTSDELLAELMNLKR